MTESANLPMIFGGIDDERYSNFDSARVLILPVSYEGTVSYGKGTGKGAMAIIDASRNMELYEEETDAEVYKIGIHTLEEFKPRTSPDSMMADLYEYSKKILESNKFLCTLGGEHSISAPIIKAHAERYHNLSVLQIDAHADLRDTYDGTPHSHACIMARVVKDLKIPAVQVGIRSLSAEEARSLKDLPHTKIFWAKDIVGKTDWIENAIGALTENVYLTIDIDGLDPSLVPTTGTPEPGGLGWYETLALIRKLASERKVVGMDLVEFSKVDSLDAPAFLCAKLIYKSLAYIFSSETPKVCREI
ncbi:MAG: agmatinase [Pyrinomonadaceae bacterium]|nr:agmatinase [Pyrinomonadaceae bacterium]MCX7640403.1 agmatinase [Pyrinomonadaceae bacterium]MDW8304830.1 agmatinase [Acidobacteriota bacterium]